MGLINPSPGVIDFEGFRALQPLYDAARDAGVWIVLRPGTCSILRVLCIYSSSPPGPVSTIISFSLFFAEEHIAVSILTQKLRPAALPIGRLLK